MAFKSDWGLAMTLKSRWSSRKRFVQAFYFSLLHSNDPRFVRSEELYDDLGPLGGTPDQTGPTRTCCYKPGALVAASLIASTSSGLNPRTTYTSLLLIETR